MASPGKRSRDSPMDDQMDFQDQIERPFRRSQIGGIIREHDEVEEKKDMACTTSSAEDIRTTTSAGNSNSRVTETGRGGLAKKQKRLLRLWYEDFAQHDVTSLLLNDCMVSLAKAIQAQPELVSEYIRQRHKNIDDIGQTIDNDHRGRISSCSTHTSETNAESYSLTEANEHLPPTILKLVEKYVSACRRRRSQNDGRRSVNTGPYRCTFGCGYRTKRAFDWRRHEETHEPQELWLCTLCSQQDLQNPFLVNRKDKFLKHVTDKHGEWTAEQVLDMSKVAFIPRAELGCTYCGTDSGSWDERCRHVLGHFEDEVERGIKRVRVIREEQEDDDEPAHADSASVESVGSGCNENEDRD